MCAEAQIFLLGGTCKFITGREMLSGGMGSSVNWADICTGRETAVGRKLPKKEMLRLNLIFNLASDYIFNIIKCKNI